MESKDFTQMYTFSQSVIGHLHILRKISCEDSSGSYSSPDGKFHIAITADGHGAAECFRSERGSRFAVEVAMDCLRNLAEDVVSSPEQTAQYCQDLFYHRRRTLRQLTDTILARWHDRVLSDLSQDPPAGEVLAEYGDLYLDGKNAEHIYGTTLIAALMLPQALVLIQQGDGRCDVIYRDGTVDQPIPWDVRCEDNVTTSVCDSDAADSIRSCVIRLEDRPVAACYLGSDGVEDAYIDTYTDQGGFHRIMGGVHTFYKDLSCHLIDSRQDLSDFEDYLREMLPAFSESGLHSRSGSGDDISVSGIVDVDALARLCPQFSLEVRGYDLEEKMFWHESSLLSKTRKHGILEKRMQDADQALRAARADLRSRKQELCQMTEKAGILKENLRRVDENLARQRSQTDNVNQEMSSNSFASLVSALLDIMGYNIQSAHDQIHTRTSRLERECQKLQQQLNEAQGAIARKKEEIIQSEQAEEEQNARFNEAEAAFQEYNGKFLAIQAQVENLKLELDHCANALTDLKNREPDETEIHGDPENTDTSATLPEDNSGAETAGRDAEDAGNADASDDCEDSQGWDS